MFSSGLNRFDFINESVENIAKKLYVYVVVYVHGTETRAGAVAVTVEAGFDKSIELTLFAADINDRKNLRTINYFELIILTTILSK